MKVMCFRKRIAALAAFVTILANAPFASAAVTLDRNGDGAIRIDDVVQNVQLKQDMDGSVTFDANDVSALLQHITPTGQLNPGPISNGTSVAGQVYDLNGVALGGAFVSAFNGSAHTETTTDALGKYTVSPWEDGPYAVSVSRTAYGTNIVAFNVMSGADVQLPTQLLPPVGQTLGSIAGIVFQNGVPAAHAFVSVSNATYSAYTDDQGRFVLANLPMADYTVNVMNETGSTTLTAQLNTTTMVTINYSHINLSNTSSVKFVSTASELTTALNDPSVSTIQLLNDITYSGVINFTRPLEIISDTNRTLTATNFTGTAISTSNVVLAASVGSDLALLNQALSGQATQISIAGVEYFFGTLTRTSGSNPFFKDFAIDPETHTDTLQKAFVSSAESLIGALNDPKVRTIYITRDIAVPDIITYPSRFVDVQGIVPVKLAAFFKGAKNTFFDTDITIWPMVITDVTEADTLHRGMPIYASSSMLGTLYLVPYDTSGELAYIAENMVDSRDVDAPGVPITFDTADLAPGQYGIYAVDESNRVSAISSKINIDDAPYVVQTGEIIQPDMGEPGELSNVQSEARMIVEFSSLLDQYGVDNVEAAFRNAVDPAFDAQDTPIEANRGKYLTFSWNETEPLLRITNENSDSNLVATFPAEISASLREGDPASVLFETNNHNLIIPHFVTAPDAGNVNVLKIGFDHQLEKTTTSNTDIYSILSSLSIGDASRMDQIDSLSWDLTDVQHPILNIWLKDTVLLNGQVFVSLTFWDGMIRGTGGAYIPEMDGIYLLSY